MSVFRQLMMRKKIEYMELTKIGNPTITDGVVSGFSSSNYLYLPNFPYVSKDWELVIKSNTTYNSSQIQQRLLRINSYFQLQVSSSILEYQFYCGVEPVFYLGETNTNYPFVKLIKRDGKIYFSVSQNGVNYIDISGSVTILSSASDGQLQFGVSTNSWLGTIDLNNSYIIIDGTKYIFTIGA